MSLPSYRSSLKNPAVEEPIDLLVHRPLGYAIARLAYPTALSPDAITVLSMLSGVAAGAVFAAPMVGLTARPHNALGAALLVASAVLDCADGQLARMRKSSSRYGRALDGAVDAVVQISTVPVLLAQMVWRRGGFDAATLGWTVAGVAAVLTGLRHTTVYDQFKNVYVRNTDATPRDCDDADELAREVDERAARGELRGVKLFALRFLQVHLGLVAQTMRWIDPHIPARFRAMPPYSPARAERYRALNRGLMRAWSNFGIGTHIFTLALCAAFEKQEWYVLLRLVGFNAALLALVPLQRRASRAFFGAPSEPDGAASREGALSTAAEQAPATA